MKIKAYHPRINGKLFLGLWLVLFAALVVMVDWLFSKPLREADALSGKLANTEKQIVQLTSTYAKFLLSQDQGDNLFFTTENAAEKESKIAISGIGQDLKHYRDLNSLKRNDEIISSLDKLSGILTEVGNNLNDFLLVSREKGDYNDGLVSRWMALSNKMLSVSNPPGAEALRSLNLIKQSESAYLQRKDPRILEQIAILSEELRNLIVPEDGGIDLADLDNYVALTGNLITLDKRMGNTDSKGISSELARSLKDLQLQFSDTVLMILDSNSKSQTILSWIHYLVILLILAAFILVLVIISRRTVFTPLGQLDRYARGISTGGLPEDLSFSGSLSEISAIADSMKKVVSLIREKLAITRALNERRLYSDPLMAGDQDILGKELLELQQKIIASAEQQKKNEEESMKRRYINEGLAKFSEILRSRSNDINDLGDAFIREMVKYLNALQGGFFVYDDKETTPVLKMVSAFAYNRKKYLTKSIALGEGLVGTCAREKQSINLTEIPEGYISITSGLGETLPDNLLLVPVLHENVLIGVLEVASLNKYKDYEIAFAEEVARSLGSTIIYTRNNQRTAELLATSQQQALEMAEQEEEMRQNMEELKATQEESNRREEEYRGIAEAIDQVLLIIEYDLNGIITAVNEKCAIFLGMNREEIIGRLHQDVFHSTLKTDFRFWEELQKNHHTRVLEVIKVGQKSYHLQEHFSVVQNRDGLIVKFINFATDGRAGNS